MNSRVGALFAALLAVGCAKTDAGPTLLLTIETDGGRAPSYVLLRWSANGQVVAEARRVPGEGIITAPGPHLGTVALALDGPGPRTIVGRGIVDGNVISEGAVRVEAGPGTTRATLRLAAERMADADGDGFPDSVDSCPAESNPGQGACTGVGPEPPEPTSDAGGASHDAGVAADASGPADANGAVDAAPLPDLRDAGGEASVDGGAGDTAPDATPATDGEVIVEPVKLATGKVCKGAEQCLTGTCAEGRAGRFCASPDMIVVPAGPFTRGCNPARDPVCEADERPAKTIALRAFELDRTEVTQAAYDACVRAGKCTAPPRVWNPGARARQPVTAVTWQQADAYCRWAGKRLPTEAEWEKAARGPDDVRTYPWGDEAPSCTHVQFKECGVADVAPVAVLSGTSYYGAEDMAGNASEWVADWYDAAYYMRAPGSDPTGPATGMVRARRGGAFYNDAAGLRVTARSFGNATEPAGQGFRCARDLP